MNIALPPYRLQSGVVDKSAIVIKDANDEAIAFLGSNSLEGQRRVPDTAKLFAASPDLLHALQIIDSNAAESVEWIRRVAREAIAKAIDGF